MAINDVSLTSGMRSNLISLQGTVDLLNRTQERLSTGKKVNSALDNPLNYFTAKALNSRANELDAYKDAMSEAVQTIKAANAGITAIEGLIAQAKAVASSAKGTADGSSERTTYYGQYVEICNQIDKVATDSGYKGVNFLAATGNSLDVFFGSDPTDKITISGFDASATVGLAMTQTGNWGTSINVNADIATMTAAENTLKAKTSTLSSGLSIINTRQDWVKGMVDTLTAGADNLTLADMNEEGANMLMLQTRQTLGTTALSLSAQAAQSVLRLFA
jgi:flagellin-like hook-associated protein FlgL